MPAHTVSKVVSDVSAKQLLSLRIGAPTTNLAISAILQIFRGDAIEGWGGPGHVSGTVKISSTPVARRVRLTEAKTGVLIREQWSDAAGIYSFTRLRLDLLYTVSAHDFEGGYNDVIAANVTAVL